MNVEEQTIDDFPGLQLERIVDVTKIYGYGFPQHVKVNGKIDSNGHAFSGDDQARLFQVWKRYYSHFKNDFFKHSIPNIIFNYAEKTYRKDREGDELFDNYLNKGGNVIPGEPHELYDVFGRWFWAFAEASSSEDKNIAEKSGEFYNQRLEKAIAISETNNSIMTLSFLTLGAAEKIKNHKGKSDEIIATSGDIMNNSIKKLQTLYDEHEQGEWQWPSDLVSYCGARVPHAFLAAYETTNQKQLLKIGMNILNFFTLHSFGKTEDGKEVFWPIGNKGWLKKGKENEKAKYQQQLIEAGCAAEAYTLAFQLTQDAKYLDLADQSLNFFFGDNSRGVGLLRGNGVCDAVTDEYDKNEEENGVNTNQGAESQLAFLLGMSTLLPFNK